MRLPWVKDVVRKPTGYDVSRSMTRHNSEFYEWIRDGVPVQYNINYPRLQLPKPLLDSFKAIAGKSFSLIHNLNQQNQRLAEARELLFPRLMNGEIKF